VSGVGQAVGLDEVLVAEEAARLEEALLEAAEDEIELVVAAAEVGAEEDCDWTLMIVTVTETVDTETLVRVEALTVIVIGLHVLLEDDVLLRDDVLLEDGGKVLDVVNTGSLNAQEQALEILLGTLKHYETKMEGLSFLYWEK
jgi:hypothetical protein